jgi:hypothetical protein
MIFHFVDIFICRQKATTTTNFLFVFTFGENKKKEKRKIGGMGSILCKEPILIIELRSIMFLQFVKKNFVEKYNKTLMVKKLI